MKSRETFKRSPSIGSTRLFVAKRILQSSISVFLTFACAMGAAQSHAETERGAELSERSIENKANSELPKILYLIPWQEAEDAQSQTQKLKLFSLSDKVLKPLNMTEHELDKLHARLHGDR